MAVHLLYGVDDNYARPLATAVRSAIEGSSRRQDLHIHVVGSALSDENYRRLRGSWPSDVAVDFVPFPKQLFKALPSARSFPTQHNSAACWLRAFAPQILGPDVKRAVYLDTDILVQGDVAELNELELDGCPVGATFDVQPDFAGAKLSIVDSGVHYGGSTPYFNSGVLVCDLEKWRKQGVTQRVLDLIEGHSGEMPHRDQDALNVTFANEWRDIGTRWNNMGFGWFDHLHEQERAIDTLADGPGGLHYFGPRKPWTTAYEGYLGRALWRDTEAATSWAGATLIPTVGREPVATAVVALG